MKQFITQISSNFVCCSSYFISSSFFLSFSHTNSFHAPNDTLCQCHHSLMESRVGNGGSFVSVWSKGENPYNLNSRIIKSALPYFDDSLSDLPTSRLPVEEYRTNEFLLLESTSYSVMM